MLVWGNGKSNLGTRICCLYGAGLRNAQRCSKRRARDAAAYLGIVKKEHNQPPVIKHGWEIQHLPIGPVSVNGRLMRQHDWGFCWWSMLPYTAYIRIRHGLWICWSPWNPSIFLGDVPSIDVSESFGRRHRVKTRCSSLVLSQMHEALNHVLHRWRKMKKRRRIWRNKSHDGSVCMVDWC